MRSFTRCVTIQHLMSSYHTITATALQTCQAVTRNVQ